MNHRKRVLPGPACLLLVGGCVLSCAPMKRPYKTPHPDVLLRSIRSAGHGTRTLVGEGRVNYRSSRGSRGVAVRLMADRSGHLRFDLVSPFDSPLVTLVVAGEKFSMLDFRQRRHLTGRATACTLNKLIHLPVAPHELFDLLVGRVALGRERIVGTHWDSNRGQEVVKLRGERYFRTIRLAGPFGRWDIAEVQQRTLAGRNLLVLHYERHRFHSSFRTPEVIEMRQVGQQKAIRLEFHHVRLNKPLPQLAFRQLSPRGYVSRRVGCL